MNATSSLRLLKAGIFLICAIVYAGSAAPVSAREVGLNVAGGLSGASSVSPNGELGDRYAMTQAEIEARRKKIRENGQRYNQIIASFVSEQSKIIDRNPCAFTNTQVRQLAEQLSRHAAEIKAIGYDLRSSLPYFKLKRHRDRACEIKKKGPVAQPELAYWAMNAENQCRGLNATTGSALVRSYSSRVSRKDLAVGRRWKTDQATKACIVERLERYLLGGKIF
jgi:hypothetical protein